MDRIDRRCLVYADLESTRDVLETVGTDAVQFGTKLVAFAKGLGRVLATHVYGDMETETLKELRRVGVEAHLTSEDGEGSAPESISMVIDASMGLALVPQVESTVLVTDDAQMAELVRRLRAQGRLVVVVVPASLAESEPARSADRVLTLEQLLGSESVAAEPVTTAPLSRPQRPRAAPQPEAAFDLENYDWARLVLLLRDLEAKMPFVGMRWLKNKVIGPHNVGVHSMNDKQLLLNRAVEDGLIETYRVGNRDEGGEPVTACRLLREHEKVASILAENPGPPAVAAAGGVVESA